MLSFEWDDAKASANLAKHGVSFEEAMTVFADTHAIAFVDDRMDYGEDRIIMIEKASDRVLAVVFTERSSGIRLISARLASRAERGAYGQN